MEFQQQPTWNSCTSACIAMILNIPVQKVIDDFHDKFQCWELFPDEYLEAKGFNVKLGRPWDQIRDCGLYLLNVPSLNIEGGSHSVVYHIYHSGTGSFYHELHDPVMGREGKKYYVSPFSDTGNDLSVKLKSYTIDLQILNYAKNN